MGKLEQEMLKVGKTYYTVIVLETNEQVEQFVNQPTPKKYRFRICPDCNDIPLGYKRRYCDRCVLRRKREYNRQSAREFRKVNREKVNTWKRKRYRQKKLLTLP